MCYFELVFWVVHKLGVLIMGLSSLLGFVSYMYICLYQTHDVRYYVTLSFTSVMLCYLVVVVVYVLSMLSILSITKFRVDSCRGKMRYLLDSCTISWANNRWLGRGCDIYHISLHKIIRWMLSKWNKHNNNSKREIKKIIWLFW